MRPSRVFRWIVRLFILVLTLSMTIVTVLGGMSAAFILGDPRNIQIRTDLIQANFNLTNLKLDFKISMIYDHVNLTTPGVNTTTSALIFDKSIKFPTILHRTTYNGLFNASSGDGFIVSNFPNVTTDIDLYRTPHAGEFFANFSLSASYSLDLISFKVDAYNISVGYFH